VTENEIADLIEKSLGPNSYLKIRIATGKRSGQARGFLFIDCIYSIDCLV
jgi:hypothetical protein